MKILLLLLVLFCATVVQAQVTTPKPIKSAGTLPSTCYYALNGRVDEFYKTGAAAGFYTCNVSGTSWDGPYSTSASGSAVWGSITGTLSNQTDLQTALNLKAPLASPIFTGTVTIPTPFTLGAVSVLPTGTELNFVDGVTSAIQTQLDAKQSTITFGTGVLTALGVNVGSAGAPVLFNGALGSPSSAGTIPAFTLGGTIAGGGNQLNNIIIGTTTPLAIAGTTITATSFTGPTVGVSTNSNAAAGEVGERLTANAVATAVSLVTNTPKTLVSLSLTAGDWDVDGNAYFRTDTSTNTTNFAASIGIVADTLDVATDRLTVWPFPAAGVVLGINDSSFRVKGRFSLASTTTVYLVGRGTFTVSTMTGGGQISARRVR